MDKPKNESCAGFGCAAVLMGAVLAIPLMLLDHCTKAAPPEPLTKEEIARSEQRYSEESAFERQQSPKWSKPASTLTDTQFAGEMALCEQKAGSGTYFPTYDLKEALKDVKEYGSTKINGQQRSPLGGVTHSEYRCRFKGAGFERVDANMIGKTNDFISE